MQKEAGRIEEKNVPYEAVLHDQKEDDGKRREVVVSRSDMEKGECTR